MTWTVIYKESSRFSAPATIQFHAECFLDAALNARKAILYATGINAFEILRLEQGYGETP